MRTVRNRALGVLLQGSGQGNSDSVPKTGVGVEAVEPKPHPVGHVNTKWRCQSGRRSGSERRIHYGAGNHVW
jgi:hypothetical protein